MDCDPGATTTYTFSTTHDTTITGDGACTVFSHEERAATTTTSLGPGTIFVGDDQIEICFIPAGRTNISTNIH